MISQREYWIRWLIAPNCLMRCWFLYDFYQTEPIKYSVHSLIHVKETLEISLYTSQTHTVQTAQQCKCYGIVWNIPIRYKKKEEEEEENQRKTVEQKKKTPYNPISYRILCYRSFALSLFLCLYTELKRDLYI